MNPILNLGKWFFVLPFLAFGLLHFGPLEFSLPYVPKYLPFPAFWVYFVGICFMLFVLSAVLKKYDKLAAVLLALSLFLFVILVHVPAASAGDFKAVIGSIRDICMGGAALMYANAFAKDKTWIG
ncbi:MAG: DoxX family protein [Microscillaceae bacterium]|nr:DoxX family protein [Microscillaceae bacterium]